MSLHIFHAFVCLLSGSDQPAFAEAEETGVIGMFREADDEVILEPQAEQAHVREVEVEVAVLLVGEVDEVEFLETEVEVDVNYAVEGDVEVEVEIIPDTNIFSNLSKKVEAGNYLEQP